VNEALNRDFICLRASRESDRRAEGCVRTLGFDWESADGDDLIEQLNATQKDLLRDTCRSVAFRGQILQATGEEVPGLADWSQGRLRTNYQFYLLTPQGKAIDLEFNERNPRGAQYWEVSWTSRFVMPRLLGERNSPLAARRLDWHVGTADQDVILKTLARVAKRYRQKEDALAVPWQIDASFAVRWAKRDQKRIVVVPAPGGKVNPVLEGLLSSPDVLPNFHRSYAYLKLDPAKADKQDLEPAVLEVLRGGGVAICEIPSAEFGVEWNGADHPLPKVVETTAGPPTKESLTKLLEKHAVSGDAPTWTGR